jgi:hypothetical protein
MRCFSFLRGLVMRPDGISARQWSKGNTFLPRYGCTRAQWREMSENGVFRKFQDHRSHAAARGIDWKLSAFAWWTIWKDSGHWHERGRRSDQFAMCRYGDLGAYEAGNVFIGTTARNVSTRHRGHRIARLPIGVSPRKRAGKIVYRAARMIDRRLHSLGYFTTPEEAHQAYLDTIKSASAVADMRGGT